MNRITGILKMYRIMAPIWLIVPWLWALLPSFAINLFISFLVHEPGGVYTGGLASIYICMLVVGAFIVNDTFVFAVSFGARRTDYILATVLMISIVSAASTIILLLLSLIESTFIKGWGVNLHFFYLPYLNDGSVLSQFWVYFIAMMLMFFLGFFPACIYQRFKYKGLLFFGAILLLILTSGSFFCTYLNWWPWIGIWLGQHSAATLAWYLFPLLIGCGLFSYLFLRRATA